jgi:hypothetical protein
MSQAKRTKIGGTCADSDEEGSAPAITRGAAEKSDLYAAALLQIKNEQKKLRELQSEASKLKEAMGKSASNLLAKPPSWKHAQSCLDAMQKDEDATQESVCELMRQGKLPGEFYGIKVSINQQYLSKYKRKIDLGKTVQNKRGRPIVLDEFQIAFIGSVIQYGQIRNKSVLYVQVALLMRLMKLVDFGCVIVEELDSRMLSNGRGDKRAKKRSRPVAASSAVDDEENDDTEDDDRGLQVDPGDESDDEQLSAEQAKQAAFENLKGVVGESLTMHRMLPHNYRWPSKLTVQRICRANGWAVRKSSMQSAHRFEGARPDMLDSFFNHTLKSYIQWGILESLQRHNVDEKRTCCEFEQAGRCIKVMVIKRPASFDVVTAVGRGRVSGTKSAASRMIVGLTNFPFICANNRTTLQVYIRKAATKNESAASAKAHEEAILNEVRDAYAAKGIAVACFTTDTGWQNAESFKKCICLFIRELFKQDGVFFTFADERNPTMKELKGRTSKNHCLFLDNASCHDTSSDEHRLDCLTRGLLLMPTPPNTTNITQALDQHVNKLFTMWIRQSFAAAIEFDIANGKSQNFDPISMTLWAAQMKTNAAHTHAPEDMVLDYRKDFVGDARMQSVITNLNSVCELAHRAGNPFTPARVARMTVGPWLAALEYARASFVTVGLAAPDIAPSVLLRSGPTAEAEQQLHDQLVRYELYPERVKQTPIAINAAELAERRLHNATKSKQEICSKSAVFLHLLPRLVDGMVVQVEEHGLARSSAELVWGSENLPPGAVQIASSVLQASELVAAQNKHDSALHAYIASVPPAAIAPLQQAVEGQHLALRTSNLSWLNKKSSCLSSRCQGVIKSKDALVQSLSKLMTKRLELVNQKQTFGDGTTNSVRTKWNTAWSSICATLLKTRDGSDVQPKRKSVHARLQEIVDARSSIASAKAKLESKSRQKMVETASLQEALGSIAFDAVDAAVQVAQNVCREFNDAVNEENNAAIAGEGLDGEQ